jgi:hypothetical protein
VILHLVRAAALGAFMVVVASSCSSGPTWVWPPSDFADQGVPFDPSTLIDSTASLTDPTALPVETAIQTFLLQTPYGGASFLATYASNGVSAARAITVSSNTYQINPLAILARAEMDQALVSLGSYPTPAGRVEYAFGCGCTVAPSQSNPTPVCDPSFAGFDKQVDCYARTLRSYLDGVCGIAGATAGGWAQGVGSTTLDGVLVTPANQATAALYQYTPLVDQSLTGGNWFFWNLYQKYSQAVGYPGAAGQSWIGDPCCGDSSCQYTGGTCAVNVPNGMCTASCTASTPCPTDPSRQAICVDLAGQGFCFFDCTVNPCRQGYVCQTKPLLTGGQGLACVPS